MWDSMRSEGRGEESIWYVVPTSLFPVDFELAIFHKDTASVEGWFNNGGGGDQSRLVVLLVFIWTISNESLGLIFLNLNKLVVVFFRVLSIC